MIATQQAFETRRKPAFVAWKEILAEDAPLVPEAEYIRFLDSKRVGAPVLGMTAPDGIAGRFSLFPFQSEIVRRALFRGAFAIFADCGMGKGRMQLAWAQLVHEHTGRSVLVLCPLAVAPQMVREGAAIGVSVTACRSQADVRPGVNVANYEMLHRFDGAAFGGVALDESSILKNFTGKTKQLLEATFADTPFRLCLTATPAPNDHLELGNHAQFLGVMPSNEMIMRWFINDAAEAGNYRLKGHAKKDFWCWVASWAVSIGKPSDLDPSYSDEGYDLPPLLIETHVVDCGAIADAAALAEGRLMSGASLSATKIHGVKRGTTDDRAAEVARLVALSDETNTALGLPLESWVIWCDTNYEADALRAALPESVEVRGGETVEAKERKLTDFTECKTRIIVTKPSVAGFGMNWQHACNMAFIGLSYSYEAFYQAVRRSWRFGQKRAVTAHVIHAESEADILLTIRRKQAAHEAMKREMIHAMRDSERDKTEFSPQSRLLLRSVPRLTAFSDKWSMGQGDCCDLIRGLADNSVGLTVTSPPFANLYIYSDHEADMGNCKDYKEFFAHFDFLARELLRVTIPGRDCCIHCKDLPRYKGRDGMAGLSDFPGMIIAAMEAAGWQYASRVTIWKDPVVEMQRTKNHGLLYKNLRADSSGSRQGMADYVVTFRKWNGVEDGAGFPDPVTHTREEFDLDQWQRWASPVWFDIKQMEVLNYQLAKEGGDEKHICPLQLGVIERCIALWSNPGDLVLDPFGGIGSTGYQSIKQERRFVGFELKPAYFGHAVANLKRAEAESGQTTLDGLFSGVDMSQGGSQTPTPKLYTEESKKGKIAAICSGGVVTD